jgi:FtsP/CotA-like multicopper oxidase with cupredoxin domain
MAMLSRRRFLAAGLAATAIPLVGRPGLTQTSDGFRVITLKPGEVRLRGPGAASTPIWGYEGIVPGPTIRVRRGDELKVRVVNRLDQPTTVHWHGLRLDNRMDGVPHLTQTPIAPGASFDYRFTAPDAGTFWYHPHFLTSEQLDRGLYGLLIVDEPEPVEVDRDIALVIDDWRLDSRGRIHESFGNMHDAAMAGRYGNMFTVNAESNFEIRVRTNERVRLRLVNVANARVMPVRIADHGATVMAIDGQPAEPFALVRARVVLSPGTRYDLFLDATGAPGSSSEILVDDGDREIPIARLVYEPGEPKRPAPLPQRQLARQPASGANGFPQRAAHGHPARGRHDGDDGSRNDGPRDDGCRRSNLDPGGPLCRGPFRGAAILGQARAHGDAQLSQRDRVSARVACARPSFPPARRSR